jgi:hypothetical protein
MTDDSMPAPVGRAEVPPLDPWIEEFDPVPTYIEFDHPLPDPTRPKHLRKPRPAPEPPPAPAPASTVTRSKPRNGHASYSEPPTEPARTVQMLTIDEVRAASQSVKWLVKNTVPAESIGIMFGGSGTFKSFIALDMALHVAHGMEWLGKRTTRSTVLYLAAEGGSGLWHRIDAWHRFRGMTWDDIDFRIIPVSVDLAQDSMLLLEASNTLSITPKLAIIDTLSQTFSGEENSATEVAAYLREIGATLRDSWQATVLILHHSGHSATERPRGSSAIRANSDFMLGVFRDADQMLATVECCKLKDGALWKDQNFQLTVEDLGQDADGDPITSLVARHIVNNTETIEIMQREASRGRSGNNQLLISLLQNGCKEQDVRLAFYNAVEANNADSKRQYYYRALSWAKKNGFVEVVNGIILVLVSNSEQA